MALPRPQLLHQSSSNSARGESNGKSRGKLVIELPYSLKYVPNSGPTPGEITLAPPADSTAYIIERILLPPDGRGKDGKPKPRKPTYIVGWHDLPGARLLVPALEVLDYVSPLEVEQWETELEKELMEERRKQSAEKKAAKEGTVVPQEMAVQKQTKGKKRGRPPKNPMIETAAMAELEANDDESSRLKGGALSFTPQKPKLEEFVGISDTDGTPSRQLAAEQTEAVDYAVEGDEQMSEKYETAEEEPEDLDAEVKSHLETLGIHLGGAYEGSLPPADMQQTQTEAYPAWASFTKESVDTPKDGIMSSWATAGKSMYKFPQAIKSASGSDSRSSSKKLETPVPLPIFGGANYQALSKSSSASKSKKPRSKAKATPTSQKPRPPKRKRASEGQVPINVEGEEQWIVKKLLDSELYTVEGVGLVRYFKVQWEGDWPEDQNPSWEPEGNLPAPLVRNYFKRSKDKLSNEQKEKKKLLKQTTLSWGLPKKEYGNVSQAFAGEDEEDPLTQAREETEEPAIDLNYYHDAGNEEDELLVVDADQGAGSQTEFIWNTHRHGLLGTTG